MVSSTKYISQRELLEMREQGFSNREIADLAGLNYYTVLKRIGKQPSPKERERLMDIATAPKPKMDLAPKTDNSAWEAHMKRVVESRKLKRATVFHGKLFDYFPDSEKVTLRLTGSLENLSTVEIDTLIAELNEIKTELQRR